MSKNAKAVNLQTLATYAAGKLASFAYKPSTTEEAPATPEKPTNVVSTLIQEAIKPMQDSLDSLQATVTSFQKRLTSVESVAGDNFERLTVAESTMKTLQRQNQLLLDHCDDLENRSRRFNLRILNIPEGSEDGKDPLKFISDVLMEMMGPDVFPAPPELERAHSTPASRTSQRPTSRTFLVCFSKFQQKEAALRWARNHELKYQGATIRVYQDISAILAKKRALSSKPCTRKTSDFTSSTRHGCV